MSDNTSSNTEKNSKYALVSLILGVLAILSSITIILGLILGLVAIVFGAVSIKSKSRGKSIAGIILGSLAIVISALIIPLLIFMAAPALQKSSRDTARKNDTAYIASNVFDFQLSNQGQLPSTSELKTNNLSIIESISSRDNPTTERALYLVGENCDGQRSQRNFAIYILLENGSEYCSGS